MKLSIIIVNYNVKHYLEQCLVSVIKALKGIESEIFIVDNNSNDGSQQMLIQKFSNIHHIFNTENFGFSKANNQALKIAKGEYALLLNPDTLVEEDTFLKVIQFMDSHQKAGGLGVKMINGKGEYLPESKRGFPTPATAFYRFSGFAQLFPKSKKFNKYHLGNLDNNKTHEIEVLSGAFMLLRKSVLDKIGFLDETFFMYGEDIDLSYRITIAGFKNYYFPETQIIHYKGESTKKSSISYVMVFYKAMLIFAHKHFSKKSFKSLFFLINTAIYFKAFFALLLRFITYILSNIFKIYSKQKRIIIVGSRQECIRIESLLENIHVKNEFVGKITTDKSIKKHPGFIGNFTQLKDILRIYKINEVIFCSDNIDLKDVLDKMLELKTLAIEYKFSQSNSTAILGSNTAYIL